MTDDEFLSNFHTDRSCVMQLNRLVEGDQVFRSVSGKIHRQSSEVHIMVLLKYQDNLDQNGMAGQCTQQLSMVKH